MAGINTDTLIHQLHSLSLYLTHSVIRSLTHSLTPSFPPHSPPHSPPDGLTEVKVRIFGSRLKHVLDSSEHVSGKMCLLVMVRLIHVAKGYLIKSRISYLM